MSQDDGQCSGNGDSHEHPSKNQEPVHISWSRPSTLSFLSNSGIVPVNSDDFRSKAKIKTLSCFPICLPFKGIQRKSSSLKDLEPPPDLRLLVFGRELEVHRSTLNKSPYFMAMLEGPWRESQADQIDLTIDDPNICLDSIIVALDFMYGKTIDIAPHHMYQVLATASMLQLESLASLCAEKIAESLAVQTIIDAAEFAVHYCQLELLKKCFRWLKRHLAHSGLDLTKKKVALLPKPPTLCALANLEAESIAGSGLHFGSEWLRRSCAEFQPPIHTRPVCPYCDLSIEDGCISYHKRKLSLEVFLELIAADDLQRLPFERCFEGPEMRLCYIKRIKDVKSNSWVKYLMHSQQDDKLLLVARRRKRSNVSEFVISISADDLSRHGGSFLGSMRSNFLGTQYCVYDKGINPDEIDPTIVPFPERKDLAVISYQLNLLGVRGPRKMTVLLPRIHDGERVVFRSDTLADAVRLNQSADLITLKNKQPMWSDQLNAYTLNFYGRVKMASKKNFQLVIPENQESLMLMFGKVTGEIFTLDYRHPLSCLQAFCIALSSFDRKLAVS